MILLDTNHVSILRMPPSERRTRLVEPMTLSPDQHFGIPVVAVEETIRGWLAAIAKERLARRQVAAYRELSSLFEFFATFCGFWEYIPLSRPWRNFKRRLEFGGVPISQETIVLS